MRRHLRSVLTLLLAASLVACADDRTEIQGDLGGWPEETAVDGVGRFLIEGQECELHYQTIGGHRTFEADIVLDGEREIGIEPVVDGAAVEALYAVSSSSRLWPHATIPYVIDDSVTTPGNVRTAIRTWEATGVDFVPRTTEHAYVTFLEEPGNSLCRTQAGYDGTRRYVYLRDTSRYTPCNLGVIVHETGHVLGLWHEHTRPDRGLHVTIHWSHVPVASRSQFEVMTTGARRIGAYDISSTMHYRSFTLTSDGGASITRSDGRLLTHDWATISHGDVAAIRELYFHGTPVPTPAHDAGPHDAGHDAGALARDASTHDASARDAAPAPDAATLRADAGTPMAHGDAAPPDAAFVRAAPSVHMQAGCSVAVGAPSWIPSFALALALACGLGALRRRRLPRAPGAGSDPLRARVRVHSRACIGASVER